MDSKKSKEKIQKLKEHFKVSFPSISESQIESIFSNANFQKTSNIKDLDAFEVLLSDPNVKDDVHDIMTVDNGNLDNLLEQINNLLGKR